ncbi:MAG: glycosyltransferase family 2 protein [Betaproteobacteria bacterium]
MIPSATHLVLMPSYNSGPLAAVSARAALACWQPVWVVVDGSDDGSAEALERLASEYGTALRVLRRARNGGKGAALRDGLRAARAAGYTHALTMDADGQHPADAIPRFMRASQQAPAALILGVPQFDASAPALRRRGRRVSNWWAQLETLGAGIEDSLFGFRVYPIAPLLGLLDRSCHMRGFDFDPEAAVRLVWQGLTPVNLPAPVRYLSAVEGGVSHFNYLRDNLLLTWMHIRLMTGFALRLPWLLAARPRAAGREPQ